MKKKRFVRFIFLTALILFLILTVSYEKEDLSIQDMQMFTTEHGQMVCQIETDHYLAVIAEPKDSHILVAFQRKYQFSIVSQVLVPMSVLPEADNIWTAALRYALVEADAAEIETFYIP